MLRGDGGGGALPEVPVGIGDYALIGDGRSAALVSRAGSVDWLCWPRFDSPSIFGALLDSEAGGHFRIAPAGPFRATRRYQDGTNVLETRFETAAGEVVVTDAMPVADEAEARAWLRPEAELVRRVECTRGEMAVEVAFEPRPGYGRGAFRLRDAGPLGVRVELPGALLVLRADAPLATDARGARATLPLRAGDARHFSLTYARQGPAVLPPVGAFTRDALARTAAWWRRWSARAAYAGPYRAAVVRSALALKLLAYAPSGAIVAAATTSLPERPGGALNWDYRFCWPRDAALTVRALFGLGYHAEAEAFVAWLLHATRLTRPALRVVYDVFGRAAPRERVLAHLAGHRGARPVRVGNAARAQLQLDVYGEVVDAAARTLAQRGRADRETSRMLCALGAYVCRHWREPDEGIWEPRAGRRHHVHSRVLCWVALDRLLDLRARGCIDGPARLFARFAEHRARIREEVEARGYNPALGSYTQQLDGDDVDASLLLLSWYGFEDAASPRMRGTYARVRERLDAGGGLLYRYRASTEAGEGAFGICGFWAVEQLARGGGSLAEARARFEALLRHQNDVGLWAEQVDPRTGEALGNFPQAFTHIGLINAALSLAEREARDATGEPPRACPEAPAARTEAEP